MKKIACISLIIFLMGCSKVQMSPQYAKNYKESVIIVAELNKRCQEGDQNACKDGLNEAAGTLQLYLDAMEGKE